MTGRLRILHVVGNLELGGGQKLAALVAGALDQERFDVAVLNLGQRGPYADYLEARAVPVFSLGLPMRLGAAKVRTLAGSVRLLLSMLFRQRWDIVHTHMFRSAMVVTPLAWLAGSRVFGTRHRIYYERVQPVMERLMAPLEERIVVDSAAVRDILRVRTHIPLEKYVVIHNGIDVTEFDDVPPGDVARERLELPANAVVVTEVAHLEEHKGQVHLIEAFARLPDDPPTMLLLVGDGSTRSALEARVRDLRLDGRVRFTGSRRDLGTILMATDVLALPSAFEGFGIIQAEAMYLRRPVVATSFGGSVEVVEDGETGYLVGFADVDALVGRLGELVRAPVLRETMGAKGRARVLREFTADVMAERYAELYLGPPRAT